MSSDPEPRLVEFPSLTARLRRAAMVLAMLVLVGVVVDGLRNGLSFAVLLRWGGLYLVVLVLLAAVSVGLHALRGAGEAERRGERLSGADVGLLPRRHREP